MARAIAALMLVLACAAVGGQVCAARAETANRGLGAGAPAPAWSANEHVHFLASPERSRPLAAGLASPSPLLSASGALGRRCEPSLCPSVPLLYEGGRGVQHSPRVHVILWGAAWAGSSAVAKRLLAMYAGLEASPWQGILGQYFDASGRVGPAVTVSELSDNAVSAPAGVNDAKLRGEVARAISLAHWSRGFDDQFVVLPAPGTTYEAGFDTGFCGYHGSDEDGSSYSFVPYAGDQPFRECESYDPHANAGNVTSMVAAHEYAESATDPVPGPGTQTWVDSEGWELADICASGDEELPGGAFVQGLWDDHQSACSLSDPAPAHAYAITGGASQTGPETVTVFGTVGAEGEPTGYRFEYGPSTAYGSSAPAGEASAGSGVDPQPVEQPISGLAPGTTYHYRLLATNASGTTAGEDETFTVVRPAPVLHAPANAAIAPGAVLAVPASLEAAGPGDSVSLLASGGGAAPVTLIRWSPSALILRIPASTPPGGYRLSVSDAGGTSAPLPLQVTAPDDPAQTLTPIGEGARTSLPRALAFDQAGDVWFADAASGSIGELTAGGGVLEYPLAAPGAAPVSLALDQAGPGWAADPSAGTVTDLDPAAAEAGTTAGERVYAFAPGDPAAVAVDPYGDVWVAERGGVLAELPVAAPGAARSVREWRLGSGGQLGALAADGLGDLWLLDGGAVEEVVPAQLGAADPGTLLAAGVHRIGGQAGQALQLAVAADGTVWFTRAQPPELGAVAPSAAGPAADRVSLAGGAPTGSPAGLATGPGGEVLLADAAAQAVYSFLPAADPSSGAWAERRVGSWLANHPGDEAANALALTPAGTAAIAGYVSDGATGGEPFLTATFVQGFLGVLPALVPPTADVAVNGATSAAVAVGAPGDGVQLAPSTTLTTAAGTPFAGTIPPPLPAPALPAPAGALQSFALTPVLADGLRSQVTFSTPATLTFSFALPPGESAERAAASQVLEYVPAAGGWQPAGADAGDPGGAVSVSAGAVTATVRTLRSGVFAVVAPSAPSEPPPAPPAPPQQVQAMSGVGGGVLSYRAAPPRLGAVALAAAATAGGRLSLRLSLHASVAGRLGIELARQLPGMLVRGRCRVSHPLARRPRCARVVAVLELRTGVRAGAQRLAVRLPRVAAGAYVVTLTLEAAGSASAPLRLALRVPSLTRR